MQQLMSDPFFAEIDWALLEKKQLKSPQILSKDSSKSPDKKPAAADDQEMLFEKDENDTKRV